MEKSTLPAACAVGTAERMTNVNSNCLCFMFHPLRTDSLAGLHKEALNKSIPEFSEHEKRNRRSRFSSFFKHKKRLKNGDTSGLQRRKFRFYREETPALCRGTSD